MQFDDAWKDALRSENPQHQVILTQPTYLANSEVTQGEYEQVMAEMKSLPVETVQWNDAAEFCGRLSQNEKFKPFYHRVAETVTLVEGTSYRLPAEAEWEFACRPGTTTKFWNGDNHEDLLRTGWWYQNARAIRPHSVCELYPNPFGLYDTHGNNQEWMQDSWDQSYYLQFQEQPAIDPRGPSSSSPDSKHINRGGAFGAIPGVCRAATRFAEGPRGRQPYVGFRVSLEPCASPYRDSQRSLSWEGRAQRGEGNFATSSYHRLVLFQLPLALQ